VYIYLTCSLQKALHSHASHYSIARAVVPLSLPVSLFCWLSILLAHLLPAFRPQFSNHSFSLITPSLPPACFLSLSLSLLHSHSPSLSHSFARSLALARARALSLVLSLSISGSCAHAFFLTLQLSIMRTLRRLNECSRYRVAGIV